MQKQQLKSVPIKRRLLVLAVGIIGPAILFVLIYVLWVWQGAATTMASTDGTISGLGVSAPVRIVRDARDVPHIVASSVHDAMFAEGYATGSDRLFQIDITRHYVFGRLTLMFGQSAGQADQRSRELDLASIIDREFAHLTPPERDSFVAFADGVNAAAKTQPMPPEYRALMMGFDPWRPEDSLAVGFATVLALTDGWYDVIMRDNIAREVGPQADAAFFSLSDPKYDVPPGGGRAAAIAPLPALPGVRAPATVSWNGDNRLGVVGSNEWTLGAAQTATGRALLANDPHLDRSIPGIWYLVDVKAPGLHVAGATLAGVPGVILGHNDHIAWGATTGYTASPRVFRETFLSDTSDVYLADGKNVAATKREETFVDRFYGAKKRTYLSTRHGFVLEPKGRIRHAVQWAFSQEARSPVSAFFALDRARNVDDALHALADYPGPTQNFSLAGDDGRAGYVLAGAVPLNVDWGLRTPEGASTPPQPLRMLPFTQLPHVTPSRTARVVSANNLPYPAGYPYRLGPNFAAPYRSAEITARLGPAGNLDVEKARALQADTNSLAELELARMCVAALHGAHADKDPDLQPTYEALVAFNGRFDPDSTGATAVQRIRVVASRDLIELHMSAANALPYLQNGPLVVTLMRALREHPRGWFPKDDPQAFLVAEVRNAIKLYGGKDAMLETYGNAYAVQAKHPFAGFGFHGWDGPQFPGQGGSYAPAVQTYLAGQSFRAVWDIGRWDTGGIDIPLGESGEPASPHYRDLADPWLKHVLTPLPFSDAAVLRDAHATLTLTK